MRKKLIVLDVALLTASAVIAQQTRDLWQEARKREAVMLGQKVDPVPAPPFTPLPAVQSVRAVEYAEVASKNLFSADRNSTVIVEVPPPKKPPQLPVFYGVMNLGDGMMAVMAQKSGESPKEVHFGEKIGEYKLLSATHEVVVLEWEGKKFEKQASELMAAEAGPSSGPAQSGRSVPPPDPATSVGSGAVNPKLLADANATKAEPGRSTGGGYAACNAGDTSPAGTVVNGMKKVVRPTPFGSMCHWEPSK